MYKALCFFMMFLVAFGQFEFTRGQFGYSATGKAEASDVGDAVRIGLMAAGGLAIAQTFQQRHCIAAELEEEVPETGMDFSALSCSENIIGDGMEAIQGFMDGAMSAISSIGGGSMIVSLIMNLVKNFINNIISGIFAMICAPLEALKSGLEAFMPDPERCRRSPTPAPSATP